mmetsp:Transcript_85394/g.238333  ORF Transcript_85394/g.238333 Transcript_85394/m.238333 type:complete len:320 (+) Transcript_85394:72-1031(+)
MVNRLEVLSALAARLGYALRKAFPALRPGDRELFLGPLADVLEDLGVVLRPTGDTAFDVNHLPMKHKPTLELFACIASRPGLWGWSPPDIGFNIMRISESLDDIENLTLVIDDDRSTTVPDTNSVISNNDVVSESHMGHGPIAHILIEFDTAWSRHLASVATACMRLAAARNALLPPLAPRSPPTSEVLLADARWQPTALDAVDSSSPCYAARALVDRSLIVDLSDDMLREPMCLAIALDSASSCSFSWIFFRGPDLPWVDAVVAIESHMAMASALPPQASFQVLITINNSFIEDFEYFVHDFDGRILGGLAMLDVDDG